MPLPRAGRAPPDRPAMRTEQPAAPAPMPDDTRRAGAILLATGQRGTRAADGFDPLWASLAGMPLLAWSSAVFARAAIISESVLVVAPYRGGEAAALVAAQGWQHTRVIAASSPRLCDSLRRVLDMLSPDIHWLVIHDAARPFVTPEMIAAGLATARETEAAAASIPVNETLKRVQRGIVVETPPRPRLALLQTPQVFSRSALVAACDRAPADLDPPDAAALAVAAGLRVALFPGAPENLRVVTTADLALAEALLAGASSVQ